MVEGPAGILACHPKEFRPNYEPSKRRLTWPNGAVATLYNAVEPDQLRGPQHDAAWGDESGQMAIHARNVGPASVWSPSGKTSPTNHNDYSTTPSSN
jgi:phage terminase large subunit-like protein